LFSYWLTQALRGYADRDSDGAVTIDELYDYVYRNVTHTAQIACPERYVEPEALGSVRSESACSILQRAGSSVGFRSWESSAAARSSSFFRSRSMNSAKLAASTAPRKPRHKS
jgi:hypothetical protein